MSEHNITVQAGKSLRLLTAGKYCDRDIVVTAEGSSGGGAAEPERENVWFDLKLASDHGFQVPSFPSPWQQVTGNDKFVKVSNDPITADDLIGKTVTVIQAGTTLMQLALTARDIAVAQEGLVITLNGVAIGCAFPESSVGMTLGNGVAVESAGTYLLYGEGSGVLHTELDLGYEYSTELTVDVVPVRLEGIPPGYTKADFIKFTGVQYIDTEYAPNDQTEIEIWFTREDSSSRYLYGVTSSGNTASVTAYVGSSGSWRFGAKSISRTVSQDERIVHYAKVNKSGMKHEGGSNTVSGVTEFSAPGNLILGGTLQTSGAADAQFIGKVLGMVIRESTKIERNLVPLVSADGRYRFWDTVRECFAKSCEPEPLQGGMLQD